MIPEDLYCGLSTSKHITQEPYSLVCGHLACKRCIRFASQPLECVKCNSRSVIDLSNNSIEKPYGLFREKFDEYSNELFSRLLNDFDEFVTKLDQENHRLHECIEKRVEHLKEQISMRIELLKAQLNTLRDDLFNELYEKKHEMKNRMSKVNMDSYRKDLEILRLKVDLNQDLNERLFYEFQEKNECMKKTIEDMRSFDTSKLIFNKSNEYLNREIIGQVELIAFGKVINRVRRVPLSILDYDFNPCSLCSLQNGYILVCDNSNKRLVLFDRDLQVYKSIERIKDLTFTSLGIATDGKKSIYISDYHNHRIIETDYSFKLINSFGSSPGNRDTELLHPYDVFYHESFVYVCDCRNQRIQKLTSNLKFEASYPLSYQPWQIKIALSTACVRANNSAIYFYSISDFSLKFKYDNHDGPICEYNCYFYEFSDRHKKLFCFDSNGKLDDDVTLDVGKNILHTSYRLAIINEKLIISAQKNLLLFDLLFK